MATSNAAGGNVLSANSLSIFMANSLPLDITPQLSTPHEAIALLSHAILLAVGFRIVGLGEDHTIRNDEDTASDTRKLPKEWKDQTPNFAFRYKHSQSSMEYLLKVGRMGSKAVIMGMGLGDDKTASFEIKADDYISAASLPLSDSPPSDTNIDTPEHLLVKSLQAIFISTGRIADYGANMRINIIQKLLPSLQKEGYQEESSGGRNTITAHPRGPSFQSDRFPHPHPQHPYAPYQDPLVQPNRPRPTADFPPPDFEDPHDLTRPPRGGFGGLRGPAVGLGSRDLYPPGMGPGSGGFGGIGGGRPAGQGGMHPTFDDPIFGGRSGQTHGPGGDMRAPLGARYDPVGPGDGTPRGNGIDRSNRGFGPGRGGTGNAPPNPFNSFGNDDFI